MHHPPGSVLSSSESSATEVFVGPPQRYNRGRHPPYQRGGKYYINSWSRWSRRNVSDRPSHSDLPMAGQAQDRDDVKQRRRREGSAGSPRRRYRRSARPRCNRSAEWVPPTAAWRPVVAGDVGLVAGVVIVSFLGGALFALIAVVAAGVRGEDRVTMRRQDRRLPVRLSLRGRAPGNMAACVRRLNGLGQRYRTSDPDRW